MDYIEIKGYKSIKEANVKLEPINILIGANGSGKSNFISFFAFLNSLYNCVLNESIALTGGDDRILHYGKKNTDSISFKIAFNLEKNSYSAHLKSGTEGFIFTSETLNYLESSIEISNNNKESNLRNSSDFYERAVYIKQYLSGLRRYHFHDTGKKSPFSNLSHIENDIHFLYSTGGNLAAFIYHIQTTNRIVYNRIIKTIQSIAPYFSDFFFAPNTGSFLKLQWMNKFNEVIFGVNDLSDGTLRFIALSVLFLQPNLPDTIVIDEPELGLHPAAIAKLAGMIQSASKRGSQVIVATQSTDLISHFMPEDIITVDQINGQTEFTRLSSETLAEWLDSYTIDDLWKRNIITQGQPNYN